MKKRFKAAIDVLGIKLPEIAIEIGMKPDTFRRSISRSSMNDGYLILIEQKFGISKEWIKNGELPMLVDKIDILKNKIEEESYELLDEIDPEKIVAYILLKEKRFTELDSFNNLVEKLKTSQRLKDIAKRHKKK